LKPIACNLSLLGEKEGKTFISFVSKIINIFLSQVSQTV
jgi:hypothetical protein